MSWLCRTCGEIHEKLPVSFAADFPDNYANLVPEQRDVQASFTSDQCVIGQKEFFLRGCLELPILGKNGVFVWGVWASMWEQDFDEIQDSWTENGRENRRGPYKGRLANALTKTYDFQVANLPVTIRVRPAGERSLFLMDEPENPLAVAQRDGITLEEVERLAARLLH